MEKLRNFVENMFCSFPDTSEVREAKAHILEGMEDRYEALLSQGKNEDEALGIVLGEFGSMEELRQELGLPQGTEQAAFAPPEDFRMEEYEAFQRRYPIAIAVGVFICVAACVMWMFLAGATWARDDNLHHVIFLSMIAFAVLIFVYFGIQEDQYEKKYRRARRGVPPADVEEKKDNPLHGVIMLSAVSIYLILGFTRDLWHPGWIVFLAGAALCNMADLWQRK